MKHLITALLAGLLALPGHAQETDWRREVRERVEDAMDEHGVVGASVAVVHGGETLFAEGFGWADEQNEIPVTPDTLFRVGSITKTLTAIAVMQLVDEGALSLDDPFADHLPGFAPAAPVRGGGDWRLDQITVRSLLTHHSGLVGDFNQGMLADEVHRYTEYVDLMRGVPAASIPNRAWAYSNLAFTMLGHMVEVKRGQPYAEVVRERITQPSGMATATFDLDAPDLSHGYSEGDERPLPKLGMDPAGSLNASANDLVSYTKMLIARGRGPNGRVLPAGRLAEMWVRQNADVAADMDLGMGLAFFHREHAQAGLEIGHSGGTAYFITDFFVWPEHDLAVIVLTNSREGGAMLDAVSRKLGAIALSGLGGPAAPPDAKPAKATDATTPEAVAALAGHYQTPLGHLKLEPRGRRLRSELSGQAIEFRATDRGTFVPYAILLGFIPYRADALEAMEIGFERIGDDDLIFLRSPDGLRLPAGIRIQPVPPTAAWSARVGRYEALNGVGDRIFDGFSLEERDGVLEIVPRGPIVPDGQLRLATEPISDERLLVPGLGRNRGDVIDLVHTPDGDEVHFTGFRGRLVR